MRRLGGGFRWLALGLSCATIPAGATPEVTDFLGRHCLRCHGAEKQKADHDFRAFRLPLARGFTEEERVEAERTAMDRHPGWVL